MTALPGRLLLLALLLIALTGCAGAAEPAAVPADAPADNAAAAAEPAPAPADPPAEDQAAGVTVRGEGWSAVFPGEPEQFVEEVPLPDVGVTLVTDITMWESSDEAVGVMIAEIPVDQASPGGADQMREQLFSTASRMGTIIEDSPVLDADGRFRGRDAVVITDDAGELNGLMFVEGVTLFQVLHISRGSDGGAGLRSFVEGFTIDG